MLFQLGEATCKNQSLSITISMVNAKKKQDLRGVIRHGLYGQAPLPVLWTVAVYWLDSFIENSFHRRLNLTRPVLFWQLCLSLSSCFLLPTRCPGSHGASRGGSPRPLLAPSLRVFVCFSENRNCHWVLMIKCLKGSSKVEMPSLGN